MQGAKVKAQQAQQAKVVVNWHLSMAAKVAAWLRKFVERALANPPAATPGQLEPLDAFHVSFQTCARQAQQAQPGMYCSNQLSPISSILCTSDDCVLIHLPSFFSTLWGQNRAALPQSQYTTDFMLASKLACMLWVSSVVLHRVGCTVQKRRGSSSPRHDGCRCCHPML